MADKNSGKSILTGKKSTLSKEKVVLRSQSYYYKKAKEREKAEEEKRRKKEKKMKEQDAKWKKQGQAGGDRLDDVGLGSKYTNTIAHRYNPHK
jgi:hypothetical protein